MGRRASVPRRHLCTPAGRCTVMSQQPICVKAFHFQLLNPLGASVQDPWCGGQKQGWRLLSFLLITPTSVGASPPPGWTCRWTLRNPLPQRKRRGACWCHTAILPALRRIPSCSQVKLEDSYHDLSPLTFFLPVTECVNAKSVERSFG